MSNVVRLPLNTTFDLSILTGDCELPAHDGYIRYQLDGPTAVTRHCVVVALVVLLETVDVVVADVVAIAVVVKSKVKVKLGYIIVRSKA